MGFVKIAHVDTVEEAKEIWSSFFNLSSIDQKHHVCVVQRKIENGSRIFLADNQSFALFAGDKLVDTVSGPGIFVYLDVFANREQFGYMKQHNEIFMGMKPEAFADGPLDGTMECYLFRRQEAKPISFTFDEATYHDFSRKMDLVLQGSGYFILRHANLLSNYALADFSREKLLERTLPEFSEEEKQQLAQDVENAFEKTLGGLSETHLAYEFLPHLSNVVTAFVNEQLYEKWVLGKGIILKTIEFQNFYPAEQCIPVLAQFEKERKAEQARTQAAKAQEEARVAAQAQANAAKQQAAQTTWQQNIAMRQYDNHIICVGSCGWYKGGLNVLNGKATLTNHEFFFTPTKLGQLDKLVFNKFTETGSSFQFLLSEVAEVVETKQAMQDALEIRLKNGRSYKCAFCEPFNNRSHEWFIAIRNAISNYRR